MQTTPKARGIRPLESLNFFMADMQAGIGPFLSLAIGGWIAQEIGYGPAFLILRSFALGSIVLWVGFSSTLKPACAGTAEDGAKTITPAGAPA